MVNLNNKFNIFYLVVLLVIALGSVNLAVAQQEKGNDAPKAKTQTTCPITGEAIDENVFTDYQGKRIYFCCKGCIETFNKDPEKYIKEMEAKGIVLTKSPSAALSTTKGKVQDKCPITGEKINKQFYSDYKGKRVYFCCKGCIEAFNKNPEKYIKQLEEEGVELEKVSK